MTEFIAVPAIVIICWFIGFSIKQIFKNDNLDRFIPVICGVIGAILGIVVYLTIPGFIAADNWLVALVTGLFSGLSATGADQIYKQLFKK